MRETVSSETKSLLVMYGIRYHPDYQTWILCVLLFRSVGIFKNLGNFAVLTLKPDIPYLTYIFKKTPKTKV